MNSLLKCFLAQYVIKFCFLSWSQKIKAVIPPHLAYGKKGYPPTIPGTEYAIFKLKNKYSKHTTAPHICHFYISSLTGVWWIIQASLFKYSIKDLPVYNNICWLFNSWGLEACKYIIYNRLLLMDYLGLFHLTVGTTVVKPDKKYYHNYLIVGFARAHFLVLKLRSLQATPFWSSRWRWFPWCHRRPGRKWSMTFYPWCVWSWFPLCSLWWDFISTRRLMLRNLAKRKQKIRRARKNEGKKNYLNKFLKKSVLPYLSLLILHSHIY